MRFKIDDIVIGFFALGVALAGVAVSHFAIAAGPGDCPDEGPIMGPCKTTDITTCLNNNPCTTSTFPDGSPNWDSSTEMAVATNLFQCGYHEGTDCINSAVIRLCYTQYGCMSGPNNLCIRNPNIRRNQNAALKTTLDCGNPDPP